MNYIYLKERLTNRYNDWAKYDRFGDKFRELFGSQPSKLFVRKPTEWDLQRDPEQEDYCEPMMTRYTVELPPHKEKPTVIRNALRNEFTSHGCHHEYDCCGCRSYYASFKQLTHRKWSVVVTSSRNY